MQYYFCRGKISSSSLDDENTPVSGFNLNLNVHLKLDRGTGMLQM